MDDLTRAIRSGMPYADIAADLGVSLDDVFLAADRIRAERRDDPDLARTLSADRLGRLIAALTPAAMENDPDACRALLAAEARLAKLMGLDRQPVAETAHRPISVILHPPPERR